MWSDSNLRKTFLKICEKTATSGVMAYIFLMLQQAVGCTVRYQVFLRIFQKSYLSVIKKSFLLCD